MRWTGYGWVSLIVKCWCLLPCVQAPPGLTTTVTMASEVWEMQAPPERVSNDGLWQLHVRRIGGA